MPTNLTSELGIVTNGTSCRVGPWVVNMESMNKLKGNLDHYLRDITGDLNALAYMFTLSS